MNRNKRIISLCVIFLSFNPYLFANTPHLPAQQETSKIQQIKAGYLYNLAVKYYQQKKYQDALEVFESISQIYPHYKRTDFYIDLITEKLKETEEKEKRLKQSARERYIQNLYARALADMERKDYKKAQSKFEEILNLSPKHEGALKNIMVLHSLLEEEQQQYQKERQKFIEEAVTKRCEALYWEAKELLDNNWPEKALEKFEEILELNPNYRDIKEYIASIRLSLLSKEREQQGPPYTLGPEDVIEINVLGHPELSGSVTVGTEGEIVLPLIREVVPIYGLNLEQATQKIKEVLSKYVKEPDIHLAITGYYSKKWYILGEVGLRGEYPLGRSKLTLMEALYRAGLPIEDQAAMGRVLLIRPHKYEPYVRKIDVASLLYKGKTLDNVFIEPGDIIYIPRTVLYKITTTITQITAPFTGVRATTEAVPAASAAVKAATPIKETIGPTPKSKK